MKSLTLALSAAGLMAACLTAQTTPNQYLDYYIVKVKPEKRADFDAAARKIVEANRKNQGSNWMAYETEYGEGNTVHFVSQHPDMADVDASSQAFMKAIQTASMESALHDADNCIISSRGEIRRRRPDLSVNMPASQEDYNQMIGHARWIRVTTVRVRQGHAAQFEELTRTLNAARQKMEPSRKFLVSQSVAGQAGGVFFVSTLEPSLGAFDSTAQGLRQTLGDEAYEKYQKGVAEAILGTEIMLGRFLPLLSNPPEAVVTVSRDFWIPTSSPAVAARAKKK